MYFCVGPQLQLSQVEEGSSPRGEKKSAPENGFARAFGGDSGTCVCRGKVTSRLSPCFAGELRILLSSIFGEKNPLGFAIFGQLVRLFLSQAGVWARGVCFKEQMSTEQLSKE